MIAPCTNVIKDSDDKTPLHPYQIRLRDMALNERPQERLEHHGAAALSDTELLAMLLRSGTAHLDVIGLAKALLAEAGSLAGLTRLGREDFEKLPGIGKVRALQLVTVAEIVRRIWLADDPPKPILDEPEKVMRVMSPRLLGLEVEKFWVLSLNVRNRLLRIDEVTSGTATASLVHPREVFRCAVKAGATALIGVHNHPSGDPSPSRADHQATRQLKEAAQTLQIEFLDHIILGNLSNDPQGLGYYSFLEHGLI